MRHLFLSSQQSASPVYQENATQPQLSKLLALVAVSANQITHYILHHSLADYTQLMIGQIRQTSIGGQYQSNTDFPQKNKLLHKLRVVYLTAPNNVL